MYGWQELTKSLVWTPRERDHLEDEGVDGKIILNCMRRREPDRQNGGQLSMRQWIFGFKNSGRFVTDWGPVDFCRSTLLHEIPLTWHGADCQKAQSSSLQTWQQCPPVTGSPALFLQSAFRSPVNSVTSYQTDDAVCRCHVPTNIYLLLCTIAIQLLPQPFPARASGRPQSLHVGTMVQQQQCQLSAANRPQFYLTFRPSFAMFMCFCCQ
jgi:hypothetical protein